MMGKIKIDGGKTAFGIVSRELELRGTCKNQSITEKGQVIYVIGEFLCILFGYILQDSWQLQFVAMAIPAYVYIVMHFILMRESARWLHSQNKTEKAQIILKRIAKINKRDPSAIHLNPEKPPDVCCSDPLLQPEQNENDSDSQLLVLNHDSRNLESTMDHNKQPKPNILDLFRTFHSAVLTLSSAASWFSASLVYYGLTYDVQNIKGNFYVNAILLTLTEIPAWFGCVALDVFGRKRSFITALFVCSITCAILPFTGTVSFYSRWNTNRVTKIVSKY